MGAVISTQIPAIAVGKPGKAAKTKAAAKADLADAVNPRTWQKFIGHVCAGERVETALKNCQITRSQLEGALRTSHVMREAYEDAKVTALRGTWDTETVEEVLIEIAMGRTVADALKAALLDEPTPGQVQSFLKLVLKDPILKDAYEDARKVQAEMMVDEMIQISDDGKNDTYTDDEGRRRVDYDVVNRSKIRLDSRKWLMAKLHWQRFGDRVQQDQNVTLTVDYAERLANARKRVEARNAEQPPE